MFYEFLFSTESVSLFSDFQTSYKGFNPRLGNVRMRDNASFLYFAYEEKCLQSYFLPSDKISLVDRRLSKNECCSNNLTEKEYLVTKLLVECSQEGM